MGWEAWAGCAFGLDSPESPGLGLGYLHNRLDPYMKRQPGDMAHSIHLPKIQLEKGKTTVFMLDTAKEKLSIVVKFISYWLLFKFWRDSAHYNSKMDETSRCNLTYIICVWTEVTASTRVTWRTFTTIHGAIVVFKTCCGIELKNIYSICCLFSSIYTING